MFSIKMLFSTVLSIILVQAFGQYYPLPYGYPNSQHVRPSNFQQPQPYPYPYPFPFQYPIFPSSINQPYPQNIYPQNFPTRQNTPGENKEMDKIENRNGNLNSNPNLPTEIIDLDESPVSPQTLVVNQAPLITGYINQQPVIVTNETYRSSSLHSPKGIHIFESKPIKTYLHRVIHSDGTQNKAVNIRLVNGVEVTESTTEPEKNTTPYTTTPDGNDIRADKSEENDEPKPVTGWLFG